MKGEIIITSQEKYTVHTYASPDEGWAVNTHIVELPSEIFIIDAQYMLPFAEEVFHYARKLEKPITRLYITHYHPDHLLGASVFRDVPMYALPEVTTKIRAVGDRVAGEEHEKHSDRIPATARQPTRVVTAGTERIDDIRIEFIRLQHAETEDALMVGFPDEGVLITQDLLYNEVHVFLGEQAFDTWKAALLQYGILPYDRILPGHGRPGGPELFGKMQHYLSVAQDAYGASEDGEELKRRLIKKFPGFIGRSLLDHHKRFLFPKKP